MGHSLGGFVAIAYAIRHPDHPAKFILSSTAACQRPDRVF
jgi:pimeloyl-ACP methyl ester carboxylesterase